MTEEEKRSLVGLAGDWHGNTRWAINVISVFADLSINHVYQLGDFGFWPGYDGAAYVSQILSVCESRGVRLLIVPGNHEDYTQIEDPETADGTVPPLQVLGEGEGWQVAVAPRGYRWTDGGRRFLALGGAPSIDFPNRRLGKDWWQEEMIRDSDLLRLHGGEEVDVMLAHDAPDGGTAAVQEIIDTPPHLSMWSDAGLAYAREGRLKMNAAVEMVNPRVFAHGHMHVKGERYDEELDRRYVSLGPDGQLWNIALLDLDTLKIHWPSAEAMQSGQGVKFE